MTDARHMVDGIVGLLTEIDDLAQLAKDFDDTVDDAASRRPAMSQRRGRDDELHESKAKIKELVYRNNELVNQLDHAKRARKKAEADHEGLKHQIAALRDSRHTIECIGHCKESRVAKMDKLKARILKQRHKAKIERIKQQRLSKADLHIESLFFPSNENRIKIIEYLNSAKTSINVCVYYITDTLISSSLRTMASRGIKVRIITNTINESEYTKALCDLSKTPDIDMIVYDSALIPTLNNDKNDRLMHHKFAIVDDEKLMIGSYNYTSKACSINYENMTVLNHRPTIQEFTDHFNKLWSELAPMFYRQYHGLTSE